MTGGSIPMRPASPANYIQTIRSMIPIVPIPVPTSDMIAVGLLVSFFTISQPVPTTRRTANQTPPPDLDDRREHSFAATGERVSG